MKEIHAYFDGACRNIKGVPTPVGIGVAVYSVENGSEPILIGDIACYDNALGTSYTAELKAMELAMELACHHARGAAHIRIWGDNQTVIKQFNKEYMTFKDDVRIILRNCWRLERTAKAKVAVRWIPREQNTVADVLSKAGRQAYLDEIGFDYEAAVLKSKQADQSS